MQGGRQARVGEQSAEVHSVLVGGERMSVCLGERVSATAKVWQGQFSGLALGYKVKHCGFVASTACGAHARCRKCPTTLSIAGCLAGCGETWAAYCSVAHTQASPFKKPFPNAPTCCPLVKGPCCVSKRS